MLVSQTSELLDAVNRSAQNTPAADRCLIAQILRRALEKLEFDKPKDQNEDCAM
jgi:hypothetical protein